MLVHRKNDGAMLSSMLQLVSSTHTTDRPYDRICVLHPIRTMAGLKTNDEELNCIALGHELLNQTDVSLTTLIRAGMSHRVITGLVLLKEAPTLEETLDNICTSTDTMLVGLQCLLDRGAMVSTEGLGKEKARKIRGYHEGYMRIAGVLNDMDLRRSLIGAT